MDTNMGRFSQQMSRLFYSGTYSDVIFRIGDDRILAHRLILATRCEYFRAMLYGGLSESAQRDICLDVPYRPFKALMHFIYTGQVPLNDLNEETILEILCLASEYGILDLDNYIGAYMRTHLQMSSVCSFFEAGRFYNFSILTSVCFSFLDNNAAKILKHNTFKNLSKDSLEELLKRNTFYAAETDIFNGVMQWFKHNPGILNKNVFLNIRYSLMTYSYLFGVVRPANVIEINKLLDEIEQKSINLTLPFRGILLSDINVANSKYRSHFMRGGSRMSFSDTDFNTQETDRGFLINTLIELNRKTGYVQLGAIYFINHIKILLFNRENISYSYYVEVSANRRVWSRIVDYSGYDCRHCQYLHFATVPVRHIRIVSTKRNYPDLHIVAVEAYHKNQVPKLMIDILCPVENVALLEKGASIAPYAWNPTDDIINGNYTNYTLNSGFTWCPLNRGEILIRLSQPYYIGSLRLLLWNRDDRSYSYFIQFSTNMKVWDMIVDKSATMTQSWQNFKFIPRPVVYIRIVGTYNSTNQGLHCVHFECPSQALETEVHEDLTALPYEEAV